VVAEAGAVATAAVGDGDSDADGDAVSDGVAVGVIGELTLGVVCVAIAFWPILIVPLLSRIVVTMATATITSPTIESVGASLLKRSTPARTFAGS
jgi:hypothetical protein